MSFTRFFRKIFTSAIYSQSVIFLRLVKHLEVSRHARDVLELERKRRILFIELHAFRLNTILLKLNGKELVVFTFGYCIRKLYPLLLYNLNILAKHSSLLLFKESLNILLDSRVPL